MSRFFVRDGKQLHCGKHRSVGVSRSTDENRRYKFIRDNMRIPVRKLEKKIMGGRIAKHGTGIETRTPHTDEHRPEQGYQEALH
jgi:hypothetical protein